QNVQVGAADRAGANLNQDLARRRSGHWKVSRAEGLPWGVKEHGTHDRFQFVLVLVLVLVLRWFSITRTRTRRRTTIESCGSPLRRGRARAPPLDHPPLVS